MWRTCITASLIFVLGLMPTTTYSSGMIARPMTIESQAMPTRCEVELDIFSGMPNPTWSLTAAETESFVKRLAALPRTSPRTLSGNLGYRGFIVQMTDGSGTQSIRIQTGTVHLSDGLTNVYAVDEGRKLERWLLEMGKPHLKSELFEIAVRELP